MSSRGAKKPAHVDYVCLSAMYNESTFLKSMLISMEKVPVLPSATPRGLPKQEYDFYFSSE